jgi:PKD repeat protein
VTVNRVSDIIMDARGAQTVAYVSIGYIAYNGNGNNGVYRFTVPAAGCPNVNDIELLNGGFPSLTGNGVNADSGGSLTGRIEMDDAIGPDGNLTIIAQVSDANNLNNLGTYVLRPDGGSTTWTLLSGSSGDGAFRDCGGSAGLTGQDWYDMFLAVNPADDKTIYVGHIDAFKGTINSSYTSVTFENLTNVYASSCPEYGTVHPDQHAFTFVEGSGGTAMLLGNDGGVYYNGADGDSMSWQQVNDDFNVNQFYGGQIGGNFAGGGTNGVQWAFGGMQDNGNASWHSGSPDETWTARGVGGDGFYTAFDPIAGSMNNGLWITEYVYGDMYCSSSGAQGPYGSGGVFLSTCSPSWQGSPDWSTPFVIDAFNCNTSGCTNHIAGGDSAYAFTTLRRGSPRWSKISGNLTAGGSILTVNTAVSSPTHAATGSSDGKVFWSPNWLAGSSCTKALANTSSFSCSPNTGATWVDVDPVGVVLPNRAMGQVAFDPANENVLYAAVLGFNSNTPANPGHIFQATCNGGSCTVVDKSGNLPDVPASSVAVNPHNPSQVFLGTYFGFYYTDDINAASPTWAKYNAGLPTTIIKHLTIDRGPASNPRLGTTLAAFTYGRGVYALKLPTGSTGGNNPPVAGFGDSCTDLACSFTDLSADSDGTIVSRSWTFGDGGTSSATNPSHTYAANGTYTVTLTVTDDGGASDSASRNVTVTAGGTGGNLTLSANGYKVKGAMTIDLAWSGATGANVDVYRNGSLLLTTANDGAHTDATGLKGAATWSYQVCEAGTSSCSNTVTIVF